MQSVMNLRLIFVWRKKGSKTKKRIKEEEMEKDDYRPQVVHVQLLSSFSAVFFKSSASP